MWDGQGKDQDGREVFYASQAQQDIKLGKPCCDREMIWSEVYVNID